MAGWNIADVLGVVAHEVPDADAVISGDRRTSWSSLMERSENVARHLTAAGLPRQATVVQYLRNRLEYVESFVAALTGSFVPVNTNFRYGPKELAYLWDDCQAGAVVFAGEFTETIEKMRADVPDVAIWIWVDDGHGACPDWATSYESVAAAPPAQSVDLWPRDGDDLVLIYTGGTTGLPKGVMWRQDDLFVQLLNAANGRYPDVPDLELARAKVSTRGRRHLPAAPLMHGAGCLTCIPFLARGGAIVLLEESSFRATDLLDAIEREGVHSVGWVGDAFARPVLDALDAEPARWDLASWKVITSGGVL
ncbi:MAG: fatty-acid--CoA ligase, partial [Nocardioidaceae bacterium]|nr:fatty-acid--CoA ligase [Nocardioidaceae bacterium]